MRWPFAACFLAMVAASVSFIPVGKQLELLLPSAASWAILFSLLRLPGIFASPLISGSVARYGSGQTIRFALLISAICFPILILAAIIQAHYTFVILFFGLFRACIFTVEMLLPSIISQEGGSVRLFGSWQMILSASSIAAILVGGFAADHVSTLSILVGSQVLIVLATGIWILCVDTANWKSVSQGQRGSLSALKYYFSHSSLLKIVSLRAVAFGILNPAIPVFILKVKELNNSSLGFVFFALGLCSVLGGQVSRSLHLSGKYVWVVVGAEVAALTLGAFTSQTILFVGTLGLAAFLNSILEVHFISNFLSRHKTESDSASGVYKIVYNLSLILGYFFSGLVVLNWPPQGRAAAILTLLIFAVLFSFKYREEKT